MAEVRNGSFNTSGYSDPGWPDHYVFSWSLTSQSIVDNTSTISWSLKGAGGSDGSYFTNVKQKYVTVNGETKSNETIQATYNGTTPFSGTTVIKHGSNGRGSFSASAGGAFFYYGSYNSKGSGTWDLPTIARATTPTLSASSVTMGNSVNITMAPQDSSFKHKIRYDFGGVTGSCDGIDVGENFTAQGTTTVKFTPPVSLSEEIPNALNDNCTIYCYTYNSSGTHIGTTTKTLTLNVPSYNITGTVSRITGKALNGNLVENKSEVTIETTITSDLLGATIKSYKSTVDGIEYSGASFKINPLTAGKKNISVIVTDSRNKTATLTLTEFTVYPYAIPQITSFTVERQADGGTVIATIKGTVSPINNANSKTIKVTLNGETKTVASDSYTIDKTVTFSNVPTDNTLTATAAISDYYTADKPTVKDAVLPTVAVTMDFYKDGNGIAMGKVAEEGDLLDVVWRIKNSSVQSLIGGLGTSIPSNSNLNSTSFINPGNYVCPSNAIAQTLSNTPTKFAFKMCVHNVTNSYADASNQWTYLVREITNYQGEKWVQDVNKDTGSWVFSAWRLMVNSGNISGYITTPSDYVVDKGGSGAWWWRKWNNGDMEVFGTVSQTPTSLNNGTNSITASLPVSFVDTNFVVNITPAKCGLMVSAFGDCNSSNDKTHTVNSFILSYKYNYSAAYTVNFNVTVVGKWK